MRHPLLNSRPELRKRVMSILSEGMMVRRSGNLIFVCGGNDLHHLRPAFCAYAVESLPNFQIFQPEFAMNDYFSDAEGAQLDLGNFEELIGELSHAIVIFPEAAGSFAETGYFAKTDHLAQKTILVLDQTQQKNDSFIMMGPARRFDEKSRFNPRIQIDYDKPDFGVIKSRIERFPLAKTKKLLDCNELTGAYDLFCLIHRIFDILICATFDDIIYVLNSLTAGRAPRKRARDLCSILAGSKYIRPVGEFGHYRCADRDIALAAVRTGYIEQEIEARLEITELLNRSEPEFQELIGIDPRVD